MSVSNSPHDAPSDRRQFLQRAGRTAGAAALIGVGGALGRRACIQDAWAIDPNQCINIRLGVTGSDRVCDVCATSCVLPLSAVRAVNDHGQCGRCCICPAYFDVRSPVGPDGLPSKKLCPRDAIERRVIGDVDPYDPLNNFYEYVVDDEKCNGCGLCVMECKDPAGLGSIRLEVRYDLCLRCNRCTIASDCPEEAYVRVGPQAAPAAQLEGG
ncbi:MAG: 4Fe-4S binding protein, partial [Planctomycetales bacterium]|nr:4Fe-4S binding protein [Planctomycetales bacterium]